MHVFYHLLLDCAIKYIEMIVKFLINEIDCDVNNVSYI